MQTSGQPTIRHSNSEIPRTRSAASRRVSCLIPLAAILSLVGCSSSTDSSEPSRQCDPGFAKEVVQVTYGSNAGYGQDRMPDVVLGPPKGAGTLKGSTDVLSLGNGGMILLAFADAGVANGDGADFIVFENAFYLNDDPTKPYAEPGQVSVSKDGQNWVEFPCDPKAYPYEGCTGWHAVLSAPDNDLSPFDPLAAGGEAYDLAVVGLEQARYVRIQDCGEAGTGTSAGVDLDAVAVIHPACD